MFIKGTFQINEKLEESDMLEVPFRILLLS